MNVLSLFNGISVGRMALDKADISVSSYFSSEIKPNALEFCKRHFPEDEKNCLGDITKIDSSKLPKIDLLIGGSPCQDFSQANAIRRGVEGKKSGLFYEYVRLLNELKPRWFLLENVSMKKEHENIITEELGVEPVVINSKLVSGQLRKRLYWTNIPQNEELKDKGIILQDVLDSGYTDRKKARCLLVSDSRPLATPVKMFHRYHATGFTTLVFKDKIHYIKCMAHYRKNFPEKTALSIDRSNIDTSIYNGIRYLNKRERARLQNIDEKYVENMVENEVSGLLGDSWTLDVIVHLIKGIKK